MNCSECGKDFNQRGYRFCPYDGTRLEPPTRSKKKNKADDTVDEGQVLSGRYTVRRFVSKGAVARVYAGDDETNGQMVAIKVLDPALAKKEDLRERFLREARAVQMIDHPNVVKVHDTGERSDGVPFLVMEYLRGETLGERFHIDEVVPAETAFAVLRQASEALWAAHHKGVVHRDLKPDNIFLCGDHRELPEVRILDFGFSRLYTSNLTAAGTVIGTPGYMAPEQVVADPVDQRTDIYGLGMIMYRMFTGKLPYYGDDVTIIAQQLLRPVPHPGVLHPVDEQVTKVILTAVAKRPEHRYPSMQMFRDDLLRVQKGQEPKGAVAIAQANHGQDLDYPLTSPTAKQVSRAYIRVLEQQEQAGGIRRSGRPNPKKG